MKTKLLIAGGTLGIALLALGYYWFNVGMKAWAWRAVLGMNTHDQVVRYYDWASGLSLSAGVILVVGSLCVAVAGYKEQKRSTAK